MKDKIPDFNKYPVTKVAPRADKPRAFILLRKLYPETSFVRSSAWVTILALTIVVVVAQAKASGFPTY